MPPASRCAPTPDLLDAIWPDRPALPAQPVYAHRAPHAPRPRAAKLALVREAMARHGATHHFVSTVDDIAWLTNLRGSDVEYNPVFLAHLLLDATGGTAVRRRRQDRRRAARRTGGRRHRSSRPMSEAAPRWPRSAPSDVLLLDPKRVTLGFREQVGSGCRVVEAINPSTLLKSRKTEAEAGFIREAMAEDGAAMCEFYAWFEAALARGERSPN